MYAASVIISVYNKLDYFRLVLAGFERQTRRDFELIIADDGSSPDFVREAQAALQASGLAYQYHWHADEGWRKNTILNTCILAAKAPWLIFVDGDCVPHRAFVAEHLKAARPGVMLTGRRVNLMATPTSWLSPSLVRKGFLEWGYALLWPWQVGRYHSMYFKGWYCPFISPWVNRKPIGLLGCNMSASRNDWLAINGFDERYQGPGTGEDSDPDFRLRLHGLQCVPLKNKAVQYHLHHALLSRPNQNESLFAQVRKRRSAWTEHGIYKGHPHFE